MTDRELLELAAKAAEIGTLVWGDVWNVGGDLIDCTDMPYIRSGQPDEGDVYWNPLEDDGDALRLAVKLGMLIDDIERVYMAGHIVATAGPSMAAYEPRDPDPYAATRRAIVRAAAQISLASEEIGKGMK